MDLLFAILESAPTFIIAVGTAIFVAAYRLRLYHQDQLLILSREHDRLAAEVVREREAWQRHNQRAAEQRAVAPPVADAADALTTAMGWYERNGYGLPALRPDPVRRALAGDTTPVCMACGASMIEITGYGDAESSFACGLCLGAPEHERRSWRERSPVRPRAFEVR